MLCHPPLKRLSRPILQSLCEPGFYRVLFPLQKRSTSLKGFCSRKYHLAAGCNHPRLGGMMSSLTILRTNSSHHLRWPQCHIPCCYRTWPTSPKIFWLVHRRHLQEQIVPSSAYVPIYVSAAFGAHHTFWIAPRSNIAAESCRYLLGLCSCCVCALWESFPDGSRPHLGRCSHCPYAIQNRLAGSWQGALISVSSKH